MNTSNQHPGPNGFVQPSGDSSRSGAATSAGRKLDGTFVLVALLAGLLCLLFSTPSARAQGIPPGCSGSAIGISLFTSAPDVHIGDTLFYSVSVFNGLVGNPTSCDASNIVASITSPDGVVHPLTLRRTYLSHTQSDFYTNVVSYVVRAQDIRPDGTVRATAEDTAVIFQNDTPSMGGANQGVNTEVSQPCIELIVQCIPSIGQNGAIVFNGTVTNCGNNTLVGVTVTNYVDGQAIPVFFPTNLLRGQSVTFTGSYVPANPCQPSTATLVAVAVDQFTTNPRRVVSTNLTTCSAVITRGIKVTKTCPIGPTAPGQLLTFSGSVSNTGNITVTNVVVMNDQPAPNTPVFARASLAPGEVVTFTGSYVAPTNCSVTDTLTATATGSCGVPVTSTASATCPITTTPGITVTEVCPVTPGVSGGSSSFSGVVRNSGNITLNNVVVVSDRPAPNTVVFTVASLAPGASAGYSGAFTVPFNVCSVTTVVRASGSDSCTGAGVTNNASATCPVTTAPAIAVTLVCPVAPSTNGGPITYSGTVRNSGNVTLNNVVVVSGQASPGTVLTVPSLAAGDSASFTASFISPADACSVTSTVTALGGDACTAILVTNTASATCPLMTTPAIAVTQVCPVSPAVPGGLLTYSGTVSNAGNVTLTNVVVVNNLSGAGPVFTTAMLAPGAVASFTGSHAGPTNCFITSTSTATGRSICGVAVTNSVSATCPMLTAPDITVTMACPAVPPPLGGTLTYTGTVSNSGNITLTNILVVNSRTGNTPVFTAASLAPGAVAGFTGNYQVPPNCCVVSSTVTATGQGCDGRVVTDTASSTCPVLPSPAIVVTKVCTGGPVAPGQLLTYSGSVSNAGDISLTDVFLVNNVPTNNSRVLGPVTLAPGESIAYTASYVVPPDFCGTDTVTARGTACGRTVTNSVTTTCPITPYAPALTVTKNCPLSPPPYGGIFTYTGTVTNTGNITLINIFVFSSQPVPNTQILGPVTLAPGASTNFTASFTAPLDCCEIPTTLNARGQDKCSSNTVTARVSDVCPLLTTPGISITRVCPASPVPVGGLYVFTGSVSNTGDVHLTNVLVFSSRPNANTPLLGPFELAPGESEQFTGSYTVTAGSDPATDTVTARGTDICQARTVAAMANCSGPIVLVLITSVSTDSGMVTIAWTSVPGTTYCLQSKGRAQDAWVNVPGHVTASGVAASKQDPMQSNSQRFYRIMVVQD